jgi:hypothetical protein
MWRIKPVLIMILLIMTSVTPAPAAGASQPPMDLGNLWLDISLGPPLVDWFNRVARPGDIARVDQVRQINLLDDITAGRKLVVFKSVDEAENFLPHIADRVDIVGYNLEHGPGYPAFEQADPLGSVKRMHDLARQYDMQLAFGPDHDFALSNGAAVAPYVDIFVLQIQRVQTNPATVHDFVLSLVPELRQANPDLDISVQVRTEGDVVAIVDLIDSMQDDLDGVSILTSPETVDTAEALVTELRTRKSGISRPAATPAAPAAGVATGAAGGLAQASANSWLLLMAGALIAGAIGGGVMVALIYSARRRAADK